jgi:hypothetical protein
VLDSWRTEVTRSCCAAPDMPDALPLPEPAEPEADEPEPVELEPEPVEPEPVEPDVDEPEPIEDPYPSDDESRRPRTSTREFTYFSSWLRWPPLRMNVEPDELPEMSLALPDVPVEPPVVDPPAVEPPVVDPPVVDPPVVDPPLVDPPTVDPPDVEPPLPDPEPPLEIEAFVNMNSPPDLLELALELEPEPDVDPDVPVVPLVDPAPPAPAIRHPVTVTSWLRWLDDDDWLEPDWLEAPD